MPEIASENYVPPAVGVLNSATLLLKKTPFGYDQAGVLYYGRLFLKQLYLHAVIEFGKLAHA
jgi:hypothetical protein